MSLKIIRPEWTPGIFVSSISVDYAFQNSLYLYVAYFYGSAGKNKNVIGDLIETEIRVKNLSPFEHNLFTQLPYELSAIANISMNILYSLTNNAVFINPVPEYFNEQTI